MEDQWLSVVESAGYSGTRKNTVYAWVTSKNLPCYKVGQIWEFKTHVDDATSTERKEGNS